MSQYTRCPHCDTAFVVREEHLLIADGNVRCGSCKSVFNAREYLMEILEAESEEEVEEEAEEESFDILLKSEEVGVTNAGYESNTESDDLDNQINIAPSSEVELSELTDRYVQIDMEMELEVTESIEVKLSDHQITEDESDESQSNPLSEEGDNFSESLDNLELVETDPEKRASNVDQLVQPEKKASRKVQKVVIIFTGLLFLIAILGTIFWFKRIELAKDENWLPMVEKICSYVECGIPKRRDLKNLKLQNREVSYGEGTMTINMLIINEANFKQAFPRVEMVISDLDGNILSTNLILPAEYLRDELIGTQMPKNVPVHIEFTLNVDQTTAAGYEFKFL